MKKNDVIYIGSDEVVEVTGTNIKPPKDNVYAQGRGKLLSFTPKEGGHWYNGDFLVSGRFNLDYMYDFLSNFGQDCDFTYVELDLADGSKLQLHAVTFEAEGDRWWKGQQWDALNGFRPEDGSTYGNPGSIEVEYEILEPKRLPQWQDENQQS